MKKKTVVQGYTIIERKQAGEVMVVVGHSPTEPDPYVTWKAQCADPEFEGYCHCKLYYKEK